MMTVLIFTMPVHFGLHTPLFPYNWTLKGGCLCNSPLLPGQCCSLVFCHISGTLMVTKALIFSALQMPNPPTACFSRIAFLLTSRDQSLLRHHCLLIWLWAGHAKGNKIRLWWRPDKVSAPMVSPGLWQASGQMFLVTPGWWLTNSISHQNSRPEPGENVKVSWKKGPQGVLPPRAPGTLLEGECS